MNQIINNIENKEKQIAPLVYYVRHNDLKKVLIDIKLKLEKLPKNYKILDGL